MNTSISILAVLSIISMATCHFGMGFHPMAMGLRPFGMPIMPMGLAPMPMMGSPFAMPGMMPNFGMMMRPGMIGGNMMMPTMMGGGLAMPAQGVQTIVTGDGIDTNGISVGLTPTGQQFVNTDSATITTGLNGGVMVMNNDNMPDNGIFTG